MKEIWKPITGYEGLYEISNLGNVKSFNYKNSRTEHIYPGNLNDRGYYIAYLYKNGKCKAEKVHQLVARAFVPNPEGKLYIDHIDTIRTNNIYTNLKWCTKKENSNNPISIENYRKANTGENHPNYGRTFSDEHKRNIGKAQKVPIIQLTKEKEFIKEFDSAVGAQKELHISRNNICTCLKGITKTAGGFCWMYKSDYELALSAGIDKAIEILEKK